MCGFRKQNVTRVKRRVYNETINYNNINMTVEFNELFW